MDLTYARKVYLQTLTPFNVWQNAYTLRETGAGLSSSTLSSDLVEVDALFYREGFNNLTSKAETECRLKLAQADINVGVALGELRETIRHLVESAFRLIRWVFWAKKGSWRMIRRDLGLKGPGSHGRDLSQNWLEYQFAWLPLMGDVFGAWSEFQKSVASRAHTLRVSRSVSDSGTRSFTNPSGQAGYTSITVPYEIGVTCSLLGQVSQPGLNRLAALGLINPLSIAWELMPFSFTIDWLIPVGSVLEALTSTIGVSFVSGSLTRRVSVSASGLNGFCLGTVHAKGVVTVGKVDIKGVHIKRATYGSFPMPSWYANPNPITSTKVLSSIALALQHLRGLSRT